MREIKFRAWDLYNKEMIDLGDLESIFLTKKDLDFANYEIMQYTGLKDKNGKEICKGDILLREDAVGEVKFGECRVNQEYPGYGYYSNNGCFDCFDSEQAELLGGWDEDIEIIGNIHENPELLNKTEENK